MQAIYAEGMPAEGVIQLTHQVDELYTPFMCHQDLTISKAERNMPALSNVLAWV